MLAVRCTLYEYSVTKQINKIIKQPKAITCSAFYNMHSVEQDKKRDKKKTAHTIIQYTVDSRHLDFGYLE